MYTKLKELNFDPTIVALTRHSNIYFIKKHVKLKEVSISFNELKEEDFDFLIVNSDQTWVDITPNYLMDIGFLQFAENWTIPKFVYAASYPLKNWKYTKLFDNKAGNLLKHFTGVSVREITTINLAKKHFGIKPELLLDPTLLINKQYYLDLIKDFKGNFNTSQDYICVYKLDKNIQMDQLINDSRSEFKWEIYKVNINKNNYIENFLKCINNSKAVITDSYHGTIFSIIFNKPFITFINNHRGNTRFTSLKELLNIENRILISNINLKPDISLLKQAFVINQTLFDFMKNKSINYLMKNLFHYKY